MNLRIDVVRTVLFSCNLQHSAICLLVQSQIHNVMHCMTDISHFLCNDSFQRQMILQNTTLYDFKYRFLTKHAKMWYFHWILVSRNEKAARANFWHFIKKYLPDIAHYICKVCHTVIWVWMNMGMKWSVCWCLIKLLLMQIDDNTFSMHLCF